MIFVDTLEAFAEASQRILRAPWAAVDTEADSLHHYAEKLSLVQISIPDEDFVIDPLAQLPLGEFFTKLAAMDLLFHAADGDIRLIKRSYAFSPRRMFDTMLAAQILGYDKIGLQNLAQRHCGIMLSKAEQKADWSERPLKEKLLLYAANDTHYLRVIVDAMAAELKEIGREEWHRQQCARLLETLENLKEAEDNSASAWQIKGARHLKGLPLTLVKALWYWRDGLARQKDRPAFKILNSEYLVQMALWAAANPGVDIAEWKEAPRHIKRDHRDALNDLLAKAKDLPQAALEPTDKKFFRRKWTERETKLMGDLKTARDKHAEALKILPSLIATNAVLETLSAEKPLDLDVMAQKTGMLPWQMGIVGQDFLEILKKAV